MVTALVVIIFRFRRLCIQTDKPSFDEVASAPVFHFRDEIRWQRSRQVPRGFNELRRLQEEDVALLEAAGCDQAPFDLDHKLSQRIGILQPEDVVILPFNIQVVDETRGVIQSERAAAALGQVEMET